MWKKLCVLFTGCRVLGRLGSSPCTCSKLWWKLTATRFWLVAIETRSSGSHIRASDRARISVRSAGTALPAAPHRSAVRWPPVTSLHQLYCSLTAGGCRTGGTMRAQYHAVPTITANNRSNSYHIRYINAEFNYLPTYGTNPSVSAGVVLPVSKGRK